MEPERWQAVESIYHAALQCEESERASFLERTCAGDQALRAEVESLLQYAERPAKFFETPALEVGKAALGIQPARKALQIIETLAAADRADTFYKSTDLACARSVLAEVYSRLAEQSRGPDASKTRNWREARAWYQKSLDTWLLLQQKAPLGKFDAGQPDKIAIEIAKCDAALAKLTARNP